MNNDDLKIVTQAVQTIKDVYDRNGMTRDNLFLMVFERPTGCDDICGHFLKTMLVNSGIDPTPENMFKTALHVVALNLA